MDDFNLPTWFYFYFFSFFEIQTILIILLSKAGSKPLLTNPNNFNGSSFGASYPSLHGLWPNYDAATRDGYTWPQYCVEDGIDFQQCQRTEYSFIFSSFFWRGGERGYLKGEVSQKNFCKSINFCLFQLRRKILSTHHGVIERVQHLKEMDVLCARV